MLNFTNRKGIVDRHLGTAALGISETALQSYIHQFLTSGRLNNYLAGIDKQAQERFKRLIKCMKQTQERFKRLIKCMKQTQGVTEQFKAKKALEWTGKMNSIRACAREIVERIIISI